MSGYGAIIGAGLGMVTGGYERDQDEAQKERQEVRNIKQSKGMGIFNREQQEQLWKDTNAEAQVEQYKKAGLNVGLMYEGGGAGGSTNAVPMNMSSGQQSTGRSDVAKGMEIGMQTQMQQAQIELLKAQTDKARVETEKTAGVDTEQTTAQTGLTNTQAKIAELDRQIKDYTRDSQKQQIIDLAIKAGDEARIKNVEANVSEATADEQVKLIELKAVEQGIINELAILKKDNTIADTEVKQAQIRKIAQEIINMKGRLGQQEIEALARKAFADFGTGTMAEAERIVRMGGQIANAVKGRGATTTSTTKYDKDGNYDGEIQTTRQ